MNILLSKRTRTAKEDIEDDAGVWLRECYEPYRLDFTGELTFSELRAIVNLRKNNWNIIKGQKYVDCIMKDDEGIDEGIDSFKYLPEIHAICKKLDLYQE